MRRFTPGQDEQIAWRVLNLAFADHWGHVPLPLAEWLHGVKSRVFEADLTL